jgi:hypothetical protein
MPLQVTDLQQHIQRFATGLTERLTDALVPLERAGDREVRQAALRQMLLYSSAAHDIATGPRPELNLVDMIVFARLCRGALERHWIPTLLGAAGSAAAEAFRAGEEELWAIAAELFDDQQRQSLRALIEDWVADHPDQVRVEGVRLSDFTAEAAAGGAHGKRAATARGLLKSISSATQAADQALTLAERGMYLLHRLPFLIRLQIRLAASEIMTEATLRLRGGGEALEGQLRWMGARLLRAAPLIALAGAGFALVRRLRARHTARPRLLARMR